MPERLPIEQAGRDVLLRVRVQPKSSRNAVRIETGGVVRVSVTAPPADGEANRAVIAFLAKVLGISKSSLILERGAKGREKTLRVRDIAQSEVEARLSGHTP